MPKLLSCLKRLLPPHSKKRVKEYAAVLRNRFSGGTHKLQEEAAKTAKSAHDTIADLQDQAGKLDPATSARQQLAPSIQGMEAAAREVDQFVKSWDEHASAEAAAAFVQRSLDLQVAKAGGLLAYNGLVATAALLLWTSRDPPHSLPRLGVVLFVSVFASSGLSLAAILSWWAPPTTYASATADLISSICLAAWRAWCANLAIALAAFASLMVAVWITFGHDVVPKVRIATPHGFSDTTALLVRPADTLRVHCQEREGTRAAPNTPPGDRMDCVVTH